MRRLQPSDMGRMRHFIRKNNYLYGQLLLLAALDLLSGFILYGKPFVEGKLYWDVLDLFSFFRDNLNSLNYFGEVAWWNPGIRFGLPMYYLSILGHSLYNPLFIALSAVCWLLGLANIHITSFVTLYSIYVFFVIPLFFLAGCLLLARQIFRNNLVITAILLLAGFSPGIMLNLSDDGLLLTAWSLIFAAAFLKFITAPAPSRFWALCLSILVLALSFNHLSLHWAVIFVPLFSVVCLFISDRPIALQMRAIFSSVPKWSWLISACAIILCLLPTVITYEQGSDLVRTKISSRWYPMEELLPGNPIEPLTISTPAIGFGRTSNEGAWRPFSYFDAPPSTTGKGQLGFTYIGLLALPLVITGLVYGRRIWRLRLLVLISVSSLVILLSAYSPLFYLIMFWEQPLRAVNHYSDMFFRLGIFYLL
ncbi:MAG: hypothetical protein M0Z60_01835, partial [Nitrospiraceae bacterium]|nr:hypothetical protein [Nitrospiraceae bacterium]